MQARLAELQRTFLSQGSDAVTAKQQALASIQSLVRRDAFIMAFNDAFFVVMITLLVAAAAIWLCKKPDETASAPAH